MKVAILLLIEYLVTTALWWWRCLMDGGVPEPIWVLNAIAIGILTAATIATLIILILTRTKGTKEKMNESLKENPRSSY